MSGHESPSTGEPAEETPEGSVPVVPAPEEEDVPAPTWARLALAAAPFVVIALVYLLLRGLRG